VCGICGFWSNGKALTAEELRSLVLGMANTLEHRGPDDFGAWVEPQAGVALGHRRLSIQDLSVAGHQPMASESGRFVIAFNGEIYNFLELRRELEAAGHRFQGHSDTEVMLAAFEEWGILATLPRLNGMFAFGVWDKHTRGLTLARDRVGKKPLYYGRCGQTLLFGSELKALRAHPDFRPEIDRDALGLFIQYGWIPGPYSIFKGIGKLPAGTFLTLTAPLATDEAPAAYWCAREVAEQGEREPFTGSLTEATDVLEALLRDSVQRRMVADVSLGALLSGGIDSTTVTALMQAMSSRPVKTFSIGFHDPAYNEAEHALAIARHLGADHTELYVTPQDSLDVIPQLPLLYDEPFADASQIPTFIVSRLARSQVTVALSGDGGDELFAGYKDYLQALEQKSRLGIMPPSWRQTMAALLAMAARQGWRLFGPKPGDELSKLPGWRRFLGKLDKRMEHIAATGPVDLHGRRRARCRQAAEFVIGARAVPTALSDSGQWARVQDPLQAMLHLDFSTYLVDDILVKVDRASMGVALEVRSPLLDYRIVEFAWRLPLAMRMDPGGGKLILRRLLERYVPPTLTERPKAGFVVPVEVWLRGPLREWAESLLEPKRLRQEGFLQPEAVQRVWQQHLSGWRNHHMLLWHILMFQVWRETWLN